MRNLLVIGQIAAALIFVIGAGLIVRTAQETAAADLGFNPDRIAVMSRNLPAAEYSPDAGVAHLRELVARLEAEPDVEQAHLSRSLEHVGFAPPAFARIEVPGYDAAPDEDLSFPFNSVTPGYLEMLEIELLLGRAIEEVDVAGAPVVAVVNEMFARRFWPETSAVGQQFRVVERRVLGGNDRIDARTFDVIGVVRDGLFNDYEDGVQTPFFWTSFEQDYASDYSDMAMLVVRGRTSAEAMLPVFDRVVERAADELDLVRPTTLDELLEFELLGLKIASTMLGVGGGFGLLLACFGIWGIVAYAVTLRRREMAVRQAMGALPRQLVGAVVRDGAALGIWGILVGLLVVVPLAAVFGETLELARPLDPLSLLGGCLVVLALVLVASALPARRVNRFHPMETLRVE